VKCLKLRVVFATWEALSSLTTYCLVINSTRTDFKGRRAAYRVSHWGYTLSCFNVMFRLTRWCPRVDVIDECNQWPINRTLSLVRYFPIYWVLLLTVMYRVARKIDHFVFLTTLKRLDRFVWIVVHFRSVFFERTYELCFFFLNLHNQVAPRSKREPLKHVTD